MKKSTLLAAAGALALSGATALVAQNHGASSALAQTVEGQIEEGRVVKAQFFGGRRHGGRGGRRAMMQMLRQADTDNDNALTQAELDAFVQSKVQAADANDDGDITLAEFETIWGEMTRRFMVDAFQRLDDDGSGTITAAERTERFGNVVSRLDRNDDGKLDRADMRGRKGRRGGRDRGDRNDR